MAAYIVISVCGLIISLVVLTILVPKVKFGEAVWRKRLTLLQPKPDDARGRSTGWAGRVAEFNG